MIAANPGLDRVGAQVRVIDSIVIKKVLYDKSYGRR